MTDITLHQKVTNTGPPYLRVVLAGLFLVILALTTACVFFGLSLKSQADDLSDLRATASKRTVQLQTLSQQVETLRGQLATKDRQLAALAADNQRLVGLLEDAGIDPGPTVNPSSLPSVIVTPGPTVTTTVPGPTVTKPGPTVTVSARPTPAPTPSPTGLLDPLLCDVLMVTC